MKKSQQKIIDYIKKIKNKGMLVQVFPGSGGSATSNLAPFLSTFKDSLSIFITQPYDSGGGTGLIRLLMVEDKNGKTYNPSGCGDARNIIANLLQSSSDKKKLELGILINQQITQSTDPQKVLVDIKRLYSGLIEISNKNLCIPDFKIIEKFVLVYYERLEQSKERLTEMNYGGIKQKIGNLFLGALENHFKSVTEVLFKFTESGIIPPNILVLPLSDDALELVAKGDETNPEKTIRGEGRIDNWPEKILLGNYFAIHTNVAHGQEYSLPYEKKNILMEKILELADSVSFLPTSPENFVFFVKLYSKEIKMTSKRIPVINIATIVNTANTFGLLDEVAFLRKNIGSNFKIILPGFPRNFHLDFPKLDVLMNMYNLYGLEAKRFPRYITSSIKEDLTEEDINQILTFYDLTSSADEFSKQILSSPSKAPVRIELENGGGIPFTESVINTVKIDPNQLKNGLKNDPAATSFIINESTKGRKINQQLIEEAIEYTNKHYFKT